MDIDKAEKRFAEIRAIFEVEGIDIASEANTRFKLIDDILTDVLGWDRLRDFDIEAYSAEGYADYILSADGRGRMVVEAKKSSAMLVATKAQRIQQLAALSSVLVDAKAGMAQAQAYCVANGLQFAALTSGLEWIAYWAVRSPKKPSEGKVIAYPSLAAIAEDFSRFWDFFSKTGVIEERYKGWIQEAEGFSVQSTESLKSILRPGDVHLLTKSALARDLDAVFKRFFSSMAGDDDPEMLAKCFVESKESREADISLEKISATLINRLRPVSSESGAELADRIEAAADSKLAEFVLIIGNKGAGKTTFIDRFFRQVLSRPILERCVVLRIDVGDSPGHKDTVQVWLNKEILAAIENELFDEGRATNEQLQGIFFSEYRRWAAGPHRTLYDNNRDAFKEKFGDHIEEMRRKDSHGYILCLLQDVVNNRRKMPCLVFDNTDHYSEAFQEAVFQYAQSIFQRVFSFVICPITDRTIWQLSKHGPFQSYETTALFLPVPAMKEVLSRRVNFLRGKIDAVESGERREYFLEKGIRLNVRDIRAFAECVEEVFIKNEGQSRIIGSLANFDVRRSLKLSQQIMTSPHIKVEDLVKLYLVESQVHIQQRQINRALLCGDSNHFEPTSSSYVLGLFEVAGDRLTSPLLRLSILRLALDIQQQNANAKNSHVYVEQICEYFEAMGFARSAILAHIKVLADFKLLDPYSPLETVLNEDSRVRATPAGQIHYEWGTTSPDYIVENALSTPMRHGDKRDKLKALWALHNKRADTYRDLATTFFSYCLTEDAAFCSVPGMQSYQSQRDMRQQLRSRWNVTG